MEKKNKLSLLFQFIILFFIINYFWDSVIIYPIKLLVVFLHEFSHGLACILTGGKVVKIVVSPNLGGYCQMLGGWDLVTLPAGYLGSMFWGALLMYFSTYSKIAKRISLFFAFLLWGVTLVWVRSLVGITLGVLGGAFFFYLSKYASTGLNMFVLRFVGFTSSLYAIIDIKEDLISRTVPGSDAYMMSKLFFLPPIFWGILWILIAIIVTVYFIYLSITAD